MRKGRDYCEVMSADPFDGAISEDYSDSEFDVEHPDNSEAARLERENMLELYSGDHPQLKLAYEDWGRTQSLLERRVEHGNALASFIRKEICHLVGVFIVVEGVLLITMAQTNHLNCESWWVFFYLSLLASIVLFIPLTQRITAYWSLHSRIADQLSGLEVLARRIHDMKTLGPLKCTLDVNTKDCVCEILKKPGVSSAFIRTAVVASIIFSFAFLLMLGIRFHCEGLMIMPQRLQTFIKFSPDSLTSP